MFQCVYRARKNELTNFLCKFISYKKTASACYGCRIHRVFEIKFYPPKTIQRTINFLYGAIDIAKFISL